MIDLRDINTETRITLDKASLIKLFKNHLNLDSDLEQQLKQSIYPSINTQYKKGI
jgi:putative protease